MLKKVYFEGMILVDSDKKSTLDYEDYVKDAIENNPEELDISLVEIKKLSDIPAIWKNSIPFGDRGDDKTCVEIFYEEIAPKLELDDKKQNKFEFYDAVKQKKEEVKNG